MKTMVFVAAALFLAVPVGAQPVKRPAPVATKAEPERVQRMSFENEYVTGNRDLGGGDVVGATRRSKHSNLVRPRADFIPELIKSAEDI